MIPKVVKKVSYCDLRHVDGDSLISTKLLKKLNITEDEPIQIRGGAYGGTFIIVREFWQREWQSYINITNEQAEFYFAHLFKCAKKKEEYYNLGQQSHFKTLSLKLTEQQLFYIKHALELGFKQMLQDDKETYDGILKMFQENEKDYLTFK